MKNNLFIKTKEALYSVLPITIIVLVLSFTIAPMSKGTIALFLLGSFLLILGMGLFSLGAELAMMPMGEKIGAQLTKSRSVIFLVISALIFGFIITIAEPDVQVLAGQVPSIPNTVILMTVAGGVGVFLVIALLRILFQIKLSTLFLIFYGIIFLLATLVSKDFLSIAFDSGGVTTGPITVPFIMAVGLGVSTTRGDKASHDDSFGLVALCSVGPILAVIILALFYNPSHGSYDTLVLHDINNARQLILVFIKGFPIYLKEVALALLPVMSFFIFFQLFFLRINRHKLTKIFIGLIYTYIGLVLFLTGVNVGFMPAGNLIGKNIASLPYNWVLIPIGMIIGFFIVAAEPAVHVLNDQVENISGGTITKKAMLSSLSIGVAISLGLSMIRILTGISIWYFLIPGYSIALILTFFVPKIFTAVAFDSGGVASGPMTATFLLPFAMGACEAVGGNILSDAFGIVAMVAMTPLVTIQILGLVYSLKVKRMNKLEMLDSHVNEEIIEFKES